jgi:hypothetical protein
MPEIKQRLRRCLPADDTLRLGNPFTVAPMRALQAWVGPLVGPLAAPQGAGAHRAAWGLDHAAVVARRAVAADHPVVAGAAGGLPAGRHRARHDGRRAGLPALGGTDLARAASA